MAIKKPVFQYSRRTVSPDNRQYQAMFIRNTLNYLGSIFNGTIDNYQGAQQAAINFVQDLVQRLFADEPPRIENKLIKYPGYFYLIAYKSKLYNMFRYNRQTRERERLLKFYDAMPLIFVLKVDDKGFLGVNFHWIAPKARALILRRILEVYPKKFVQDEVIRPMSYKLFLQVVGPYRRKFLKFAIRRYLWSQIRPIKGVRILRIPATEFVNACNFTSAMWVGITEREVVRAMRNIGTINKKGIKLNDIKTMKNMNLPSDRRDRNRRR